MQPSSYSAPPLCCVYPATCSHSFCVVLVLEGCFRTSALARLAYCQINCVLTVQMNVLFDKVVLKKNAFGAALLLSTHPVVSLLSFFFLAAGGLQSLPASLVSTASCRSRLLLLADSEKRRRLRKGITTLTGVKKSSTEAWQTRMSQISGIQLLRRVILAPLHERAVKINQTERRNTAFGSTYKPFHPKLQNSSIPPPLESVT